MKGVVTIKDLYIMVDIVRYVLYKLSIIIWDISSLVQGCILVKKTVLLGKKNKSQGDGEYLSENVRRSDDGAVPINQLVKALESLEVALLG